MTAIDCIIRSTHISWVRIPNLVPSATLKNGIACSTSKINLEEIKYDEKPPENNIHIFC